MGNYNDKLEKKYYKRMLEIIKQRYNIKKLFYKNATGTLLDMTQCTDFELKINNEEIILAFRMRGHDYITYNDCTIRAYNKGSRTEIDKIFTLNKKLIYFYGYESENEKGICKYVIYEVNDKVKEKLKYKNDLFDVVKQNFFNKENITVKDFEDRNHKKIADIKNNTDGETALITITIEELKECNAIIFSSEDI